MLFHDNIALFLPLKPSYFRHSTQLFVGQNTKNSPSFPASVFALPPKILHRYSIVSPSILHRNDGPAMELRWNCDGATSDFLPCFFFESKEQKMKKRKKLHY
jgi:hypothetical protein